MMLSPKDKLPDFELPDQSGIPKSFKELAGPNGLILFVYSKDNTSGCTAEAGEFQEKLASLKKLGFGLAGISKDSVQSHLKFADKLGLGYSLLSDPEAGLMQALGSWVEKKRGGKVSMGALRSTFVADGRGEIVMVYPKVKAKGHAAAVLADLSRRD